MDRRTVATSLAAVALAGAATARAETKAPVGARPSFVETDDGASLFYLDWGTGKPVLFIHAWALNADIWEYQLTELVDQGARCVAYDRRGHGRSSDPGRGYDFDRLADDLAAVIDWLDLHDVTLVGFSMGNGEAVRYLSRHGSSRIARLVMVSTIPPHPTANYDAFIAALKQDRPAFFAHGRARGDAEVYAGPFQRDRADCVRADRGRRVRAIGNGQANRSQDNQARTQGHQRCGRRRGRCRTRQNHRAQALCLA